VRAVGTNSLATVSVERLRRCCDPQVRYDSLLLPPGAGQLAFWLPTAHDGELKVLLSGGCNGRASMLHCVVSVLVPS
jgi:hypothetical protein